MKATYVNHMGNDLSVVNAARVSFGKQSEMEEVGSIFKLKEKDAKLINYLAKHNHKSPFNHTYLTFHIKAPIFVARQLVKHKFMPWNEVSRRYVDDEPEFYIPKELRKKAKDKKQGSSEKTIKSFNKSYIWEYNDFYPVDDIEDELTYCKDHCLYLYEKLLESGVAPEQARMILPLNTYTEWYWSGTLGAYADMYNLRSKEDTQWETRQIALEIGTQIEPLFPVSWRALTSGE